MEAGQAPNWRLVAGVPQDRRAATGAARYRASRPLHAGNAAIQRDRRATMEEQGLHLSLGSAQAGFAAVMGNQRMKSHEG